MDMRRADDGKRCGNLKICRSLENQSGRSPLASGLAQRSSGAVAADQRVLQPTFTRDYHVPAGKVGIISRALQSDVASVGPRLLLVQASSPAGCRANLGDGHDVQAMVELTIASAGEPGAVRTKGSFDRGGASVGGKPHGGAEPIDGSNKDGGADRW